MPLHVTAGSPALQPLTNGSQFQAALDTIDLTPLLAAVQVPMLTVPKGRDVVLSRTALVWAYLWSRYPGTDAPPKLAPLHRRLADPNDGLGKRFGFTAPIPHRTTFNGCSRASMPAPKLWTPCCVRCQNSFCRGRARRASPWVSGNSMSCSATTRPSSAGPSRAAGRTVSAAPGVRKTTATGAVPRSLPVVLPRMPEAVLGADGNPDE